MFGWLLHIANEQPPLDAPYHTLGGRVPSAIRVDNHLTEGDVVSLRSTATRMGEESIISQYSINPRNPIVATPFGGVIFPLECVHDRKGGWQQLVDDGGVESTYRVGCGEAGERRRWGGRLMGSGGCIRLKGGASRRSAAVGEVVETSGSSDYEIFYDFWTMGR